MAQPIAPSPSSIAHVDATCPIVQKKLLNWLSPRTNSSTGAAKTALNPQAAWPFPTGSKP